MHYMYITPRYAYATVRSLMGLRTFGHQDLKITQPLTCMICTKAVAMGRASFKDNSDKNNELSDYETHSR